VKSEKKKAEKKEEDQI